MNQPQIARLTLMLVTASAVLGCSFGLKFWSSDNHEMRPRYIGTALYISTVSQSKLESSRHRRSTEDKPTIKSLTVQSNINARFATTRVLSTMSNDGNVNQDASFIVQIPETAFMSNFSMYIDGEWHVAEVKEKRLAENEFKEARNSNKTAGLVSSDNRRKPERGMEYFSVAVTIKGNSSINFELEYLELIQRRRGVYEQRISIRPQQIVEQLEVYVAVYEPQGIAFLDVVEPASGTNSVGNVIAEVTHTSAEVKQVSYTPNTQQQRDMNKTSGINGDLLIRYDTEHPYDAGLIQFEDDYFVHFFSPSDVTLVPLPKMIVFVIDISGSMSGDKMAKTRDSMQTILGQLRNEDKFMLLLFDDEMEQWPSSGLVHANADNVMKAKRFANDRLVADGGTNIHSALLKASQILKASGKQGANMIVFLTDGEPTVGVTDRKQIINEVSEAAAGQVAIFSLGYGYSLDYDLLAAISYENGGFAKRIYDEVDASIQLAHFFEEVNTPLAYNVEVIYLESEIDLKSLTKNRFPQYFNGSEIVVAGKMNSEAPKSINARVKFVTDKVIELPKVIDTSNPLPVPQEALQSYQPGFLEKLYVYMKIKDLLLSKLIATSDAEATEIENYALQLALDYNLVTPLTSMIVVQPERPNFDMEADLASYPASGSVLYASGVADRLRGTVYVYLFLLFSQLLL